MKRYRNKNVKHVRFFDTSKMKVNINHKHAYNAYRAKLAPWFNKHWRNVGFLYSDKNFYRKSPYWY